MGGVGGRVRVLLTGMSGTGKSTVLARLRDRGLATLDIDDEGLLEETAMEALWREADVRRVLAETDGDLVLAGCAANQVGFYPDLDHVVLLTAPESVLRARLTTRRTNPFGKNPAELARVLADLVEVEPLLRRGATLTLDTSVLDPDQVADAVIAHAGLARRGEVDG